MGKIEGVKIENFGPLKNYYYGENSFESKGGKRLGI